MVLFPKFIMKERVYAVITSLQKLLLARFPELFTMTRNGIKLVNKSEKQRVFTVHQYKRRQQSIESKMIKHGKK